jgi:glutathione S-transferase
MEDSHDILVSEMYCSNKETFYYPSGENPKPITNNNYFRIYGHELCPFAQRAFFTFSAKNLLFQKVHVDLRQKAKWHLEFNEGLVPILETPKGDLIPESGFIAQFASDYTDDNQGILLWPNEGKPKSDNNLALETAKHRIFIQKFDKLMLSGFYGAYLSNFCDEEKNKNLINVLNKAEELFKIQMNGSEWLSQSNNPMYIDICAFTLVERVAQLKGSVWNHHYEVLKFEDNYPIIADFIKRFQKHESLKDHIITSKAYHAQIATQNLNQPGIKAQLSIEVFNK